MTDPTTGIFAPLTGIRVIELSHMIMGPSAGQYLAFMGAEVIKVEPPEGDKTRQLTGMGAGFFPMFNRGKQSVCLDLQTDSGRAELEALLASADVFIDNFKDSTLTGLGLDGDALRARHPQLIVASSKGFLTGPYQNRTAMDEVVQMMTGLAYMTGPSGRPLRVGSSANDMMAGLFAAFAVMGALMERGASGAGRDIRVGLFESCLFLVGQHMVQFDIEGTVSPPMPERTFSWPVYDIFETADGTQLFIGAITGGHWTSLCEILGLDALSDDPALNTSIARIKARPWTVPKFAVAVSKCSSDELARAMEAHDIPFAPINKPADMYADPHVCRDGGLVTTEMPDGTTYRAPGLPFEVDGQHLNVPRRLPEVGEDTERVLGPIRSDSRS
jgi:crotonobetainyl-CoA:carnitine CoA-transferase CaiB-like acyl-CoA transferase